MTADEQLAALEHHLQRHRAALFNIAARNSTQLRMLADVIDAALLRNNLEELVHAVRHTDPALAAKLQELHELSHFLSELEQ